LDELLDDFMKRLLAICLVAAGFSAAGAAVPQTPTPQIPAPQAPAARPAAPRGQTIEGVVAIVNGQVVSQSDVRNRMRWILLSFSGQPDEQIYREAQQRAIDQLIDERIQLQEFRKLVKDKKIEAAEIDQRIADLARQNRMTSEQFLAELSKAGINTQSLRDQMEADIAWTSIIRGRYARTVRVSDLRIDEMMDRIKASLDKPQYRVAEIFLYAPDQASRTNAMTRADGLIKEINRGADFQQVAQQFSAAPSASAGGDMGWMSPGDMRPEIWTAVQAAPAPPTLLPPIQSEGGVYIVALTGKREPSKPGAAVLDLKQVVARGDGAAGKLQQIKAKAKTCDQVAAATNGAEGVTPVDMNDVAITQLAAAYRPALEALQAGQSSDVLDLGDDGKVVFYVCQRQAGAGDMPTRDDLHDRLFQTEIAMIADRYLRDLKREATIERR
jgi:peptidyl-prolyl cis-trans isomerase SurA